MQPNFFPFFFRIIEYSEDITVVIMPRDRDPAPMEESGNDSTTSSTSATSGISFLSGTCPDPSCQTKLYCLSNYPSVECPRCGQRHELTTLHNVREEKGDVYNTALFAIKSLLAGIKPEPGTDNIKVRASSRAVPSPRVCPDIDNDMNSTVDWVLKNPPIFYLTGIF